MSNYKSQPQLTDESQTQPADEARPQPTVAAKSKILFQLSGSIACFKACAALSKLAQAGHEIEVVASVSALKFVGEATLEGLTGRKVHKETFESGAHMDHIHLVRWADVIVLCPATANTLNKLAAGIGDDLISTMFLAHDFKKPYLIAPAMNQFMWSHPATQASVSKLQSWGLNILGTSAGSLACGEIGEGRLLEPEEIVTAIEMSLLPRANTQSDAATSAQKLQPSLCSRKILITSGGTAEPIDGVRSITNTSSGRTGAELAAWFAKQGDEVTLLHAKSAVLPSSLGNISFHAHEITGRQIALQSFSSFSDLQSQLSSLLKNEMFDVAIHLAAVADYSVAEVESNGAVHQAPLKEKIDSGEELTLRLKKNPKLVDSIRALSKNKTVKVVAFKLTSTDSEEARLHAVAALAQHSNADVIVHNDATQMSKSDHPFRIFMKTIENANLDSSLLPLHAYGLQASGLIQVATANGASALGENLNELLHSGPTEINKASFSSNPVSTPPSTPGGAL